MKQSTFFKGELSSLPEVPYQEHENEVIDQPGRRRRGAKKHRVTKIGKSTSSTGKARKSATGQKAEKSGLKKTREPLRFPTRTVDYSKMVEVHIDHRTTIYIKPGEDPELARQKYMERLQASRLQLRAKKTTVPVSRFKPLK